jgi:hypothetical protein
MTSQTGQLGQDIRDRTVSKGQPNRQPGQGSLERTEIIGLPEQDGGVRRAVANVAWIGQLEQEDSWDRTDRSEQDVLDRTRGTKQLGQDSRDRSDWTSRPTGNLDRTMFRKSIIRKNSRFLLKYL